MITKLLDYFCVACGGWFRSACPHGPGVTAADPHTYCAECGWWVSGCPHQ
jgi:hypothetical protein